MRFFAVVEEVDYFPLRIMKIVVIQFKFRSIISKLKAEPDKLYI